MAGLGELLNELLGGQKKASEEMTAGGYLSRTAAMMYKALSLIPGSPFPPPEAARTANTLIDKRAEVAKALGEGDVKKAAEEGGILSDTASDALSLAFQAGVTTVSGKTAQAQLEALIGQPIPETATTTKAVMEQLALLTQANEAIQALSIAGEIGSLGQIDRIGEELRSYLDYSGVSQISGFGYGQILGTVIGTRMSQEMLSVTRPSIASVSDLSVMRMRELIDQTAFNNDMGRLGYPDDTSDRLYKIAHFYPQPQDWIRFAVRDVFTPATVESAGLNQQFPDDIVPLAEKGGVSEEHMRMFWAAHWELPSPNMAYEMLHRGRISLDELRQLLRAADYAPGYVEDMIAIAYSPYTRVDARRMWDLGVLDDEGFISAMKEIGYDDIHAANMLKCAYADSAEKEKDLSGSQMSHAYTLGLTSRSAYHDYLVRSGYDDSEADLIIRLTDEKKTQKVLEEFIDLKDFEFARGEISPDVYLSELSSKGIPLETGKYHLSRAIIAAEKKTKLPTKADIEKWLKGEYINTTEAERYLTSLGYKGRERSLYLHEWTSEMQEAGTES